MTDATPDYGDPTDWDAIPAEFATALETELAKYGWTVLDAHDTAVIIDIPGLSEDEEWYLGKPNYHGWWCYGIAVKGYCANPEWLYVDAADPEAVAAAATEILRARHAN